MGHLGENGFRNSSKILSDFLIFEFYEEFWKIENNSEKLKKKFRKIVKNRK